jgi:hypothetical protein
MAFMKIRNIDRIRIAAAILMQAVALVLAAEVFAADGVPPTVSILNPKPGTPISPTTVSLRPSTLDFKVQVQVWDDLPITAGSVQVGYYSGASPDSGSFNMTTATLNTNYTCGTGCSIYDALIAGLSPGADYYLYARAVSADGTGESRQNRTGNNARYVFIRVVAPKTGTGMLLARDSSSMLCIDCHDLPLHSSQSISTQYQNWQTVCLDCHTPHSTRNLYLIKEAIDTPNGGARTVRLYSTAGDAPNSYANSTAGPATAGVCQVCHTQTKNPATLAARWTSSGASDTTHYLSPATRNCASCHVHKIGFSPSCGCHAAPVGSRRQVLGPGGDFDKPSHHVVNYANSADELITMADCLVCHDMAAHMAGMVRLRNKDDAGQIITYQSGTPASLEPFCLSCHDTNGATTEPNPLTPFSDGNTLGVGMNVAGNRIAGYWNGSNTVHKNNGLTCAGSGASATGCHGDNGAINMHGSSSRGLLTRNMTNPIPPTSSFAYDDYKLCFDCHENYPAVTKEVVLGYRSGGNYDLVTQADPTTLPPTPYYTSGIQSLFRDRYAAGSANYPSYWGGLNQTYNNDFWFPGGVHLPLHNFHLLGNYYSLLTPSIPNWLSWNYRGDSAQQGRITCASCHNVHGGNASVRSAYDELLLVRLTGTGPDLYTRLPAPPAKPDVMTGYPSNCTADCHGMNGKSTYWYSPADE